MLRTFTRFLKFNFVNLPLKSKYYHKQLPNQANQVIKMIKRESVLNQKCFLLEHLSDLMIKDTRIILSSEQRKIVSQELNKWKNQSGRFQHIATVVWVIKRLNLQRVHEQLYNQIKQRFLDDQWYVNFDESVKALQAFKDLPDGEQKKIIMQKIERNVGLTMWNVNMKYYARIATGLLEAGRVKSQLWSKMETQILQNLGMQYDTRTLCDIFKAYALSHNGNDIFYQMMEKVLLQGHFDQYNFLNFKNFSKQYDDSGEFFSLVIETYAIARKSCGVILTPDFKDYVYEALMDKKTEYKSLGSLTKSIMSLQAFEFEPSEIKQIQQNLLSKRPTIFSIDDIKQFYELMEFRHGEIPQQIHSYIEALLVKEIRNKFIPAYSLVDLVGYLIDKKLLFDQKLLIGEVNSFLQNNFKYLSGEQRKYVIHSIQQTKKLTQNQQVLKLSIIQKKTENKKYIEQ